MKFDRQISTLGKMKCIYFVCIYLIFGLGQQVVDTASIFATRFSDREVRFTTFEVDFVNKSTATLLEASFKQFKNTQALFLRFIIHEKVNQFHIKIGVLKCKDHYVDCTNVISYEMCNVCEKLSLLMYFLKDSPSAIKRCPVIGEFAYKNLTMDADKFGSTFGLPGERWWEYYWRTTALFYTGENVLFATWKLDNYFIEFRNRNRKPIL